MKSACGPREAPGVPDAAAALGWPAGGKRGEAPLPGAREWEWGPTSIRKRLRPARGAGGERGKAAPPSAKRAGVGPREH